MKNLYKILGIIAIGAVISFSLAGCSMGGGSSTGGKPADLGTDATADDAFAKLQEIYDNPDTPQSTKDAVKNMMDNWDSYSQSWAGGGNTAAIAAINELIKDIPDTSGTGTGPSGTGTGPGGDDDEEAESITFKPSDLGIDKSMTAETLLQAAAEYYYEGTVPEFTFADFIDMGGELYVNGVKVTSRSKSIKPTDNVEIVPPSDFGGDDGGGDYTGDDDYNGGDNYGDGGDNYGGGGSSGISPLSSNATAAEALKTLNAIIAYSGTPTTIRQSAEAIKNQWSGISQSWTTYRISMIPTINNMIVSIDGNSVSGYGNTGVSPAPLY
jgi:hypothetical protein